MGPRNRVRHLLLALCLAVTPIAYGQDTAGDFHTRDDDARKLYSVSAFAHGHRHGYEEGFHAADLDIHVGRLQRTLRDKDVPKPDYQKHYGSKNHFGQGFIQGFKAGYIDSYQNREFRVVQWTREIPPFAWMQALPQADEGSAPSAKLRMNFDEGARRGYQSGMMAKVANDDIKSLADRAKIVCSQQSGTLPEGYCDGFAQGFLLGVNDYSPAPLAPQTANGVAQSSTKHPQAAPQPQ